MELELTVTTFYIYKYRLLKVGLSPSKKISVICFIESLLKTMKNVFLRYLSFCHDFLVTLKKR